MSIAPVSGFGTAKWIVSATAGQGTHTTIASALTAASSGDTIFIRPGTYTENLTLKAGVNIVSFQTADSGQVVIIGKATLSSAGLAYFSGIEFQTNSDFFLVSSGSGVNTIEFDNCLLNCSNNTGVSFTNSNSSSTIAFYECVFLLQTTGIALFSSSSAGGILIQGCVGGNPGLSTTVSSASAGSINVTHGNLPFQFGTTGTAGILVNNSYIDCGVQNGVCVTANGTGTTRILNNYLGSGTASAITIGTGVVASVSLSEINSTNTNAITGAGTLFYQGLTFNSSSLINVTTQTGGTLIGGTFQAPSAGILGEQIRSFVASGSAITLSSGNAANITSISLTPGIWDISALPVIVSAASTVNTGTAAAISATSATLGNYGDNQATWDYAGGIGALALTLAIPAYRVTLTTTTTYYLVAYATFSGSTTTAYGRISATRVG